MRTGQDLQGFPVHLQQFLLEPPVVFSRSPNVPFAEGRILFLEVSYSPIQFSEDVIQPIDENFPMAPHADSAKVFPNRGANFGETARGNVIPLRPDEKEERFENFNISEFPNAANNGTLRSQMPPPAYWRERWPFLQPRPNVDGNVWL